MPLSLGLHFQCTLTSLDVSNNGFGDAGCVALAKALRKNRTLTALNFDGNGIQLEGLKAIKGCLIGNQKLLDVPFPHIDMEVSASANRSLYYPKPTWNYQRRTQLAHSLFVIADYSKLGQREMAIYNLSCALWGKVGMS